MGVQLGDNVTFRGTLTRGGSTWPAAVAAARFLFVRPDGTTLAAAGTVENGTTAVVSYATAVADIDQIGQWNLYVSTTDANGKVLTMTEPHSFSVLGE